MSEKIGRRDFVKKIALVGGAVVAGGTILSKPPRPNISAEPTANNQENDTAITNPISKLPETPAVEGPKVESMQPERSEAMAWLPEEVQALWPIIVESANQFDIDPRLVAIIIIEESGGRNVPNSTGSGATGPMQLMPIAVEEYNNKSGDTQPRDINNPVDNIYIGCWYIDNINSNYLKPSNIDMYSDFGIMSLAVGYGDGAGALRAWQRGGMKLANLSKQAQYITRLWTGMWHERDQSRSYTLNTERGYNT